MESKRKSQIAMIAVLAVAVVALGVGFAAFSTALTISSSAEVTPDDSQFKVVFTNPNGLDVISMEGEIPVLEDARDYPDEYKGVNVAMDWLNVDFKCSGEYRITVYYNNKEIYTRTIYAKGKNE